MQFSSLFLAETNGRMLPLGTFKEIMTGCNSWTAKHSMRQHLSIIRSKEVIWKCGARWCWYVDRSDFYASTIFPGIENGITSWKTRSCC